MRILLDTNVLLDYFQHREGFTTSEKILQACADNSVSGFVAAHSFPNMFYILRKFYSDEERREILTNIISLLNVAEISHSIIASALSRKTSMILKIACKTNVPQWLAPTISSQATSRILRKAKSKQFCQKIFFNDFLFR